jgi:hypothetical protein
VDGAAEKDSRFYLPKPEFAERLALFALENPEPQDGSADPTLNSQNTSCNPPGQIVVSPACLRHS